MLDFPIRIAQNGLSSNDVDAIVYVTSKSPTSINVPSFGSLLKQHEEIDEAFSTSVTVHPVNLPAGRLIFSPIAKLTDYDDVRSYAEAGSKGIERALKAGAKEPLVVLPKSEKFTDSELVTLLGVLESLYVPIQLREDVPEKRQKVKSLSVWCEDDVEISEIIKLAEILEAGRVIARDIGGGDPERMAAPRVEDYVRNIFGKTQIKINVINDPAVFAKEYPLFAAVNRAASVIERHRGRIIYLKYEPEEDVKKTIGIVGKGITYDTGGADIKINLAMTGMSRDKCGAAAVAGFMKIVSVLKPKNVRIIGAMCLARNSVGENGYVTDEVITARSKARVRVNNTDAEGRFVMADVLCKLKEEVAAYDNPHLFTIATLTGHAWLSVGPYSIALDNSVAKKTGNCLKLQEAGIAIGDPFEVSYLRREDFSNHKGTWEGDDVNQCNKASSTRTQRGHQGPAAFLMLASGLDKHGVTSPHPIKYTHIDIAGSCGDPPHEPKASPVLALYATYLKDLIG